jgi:hypothetical protein
MKNDVKNIDNILMAILEDNVDYAKRRLNAYKEACPDCRKFDDVLLRENGMNVACYNRAELYGKDDAYYCNTCHRCVYISR